MAATVEFFALERFDFEGNEEIPGFAVPTLGRLPDAFQSYPRIRLLPEEIQKVVFDARDPSNDVTDPADPIVAMTAWDCIRVGAKKRPQRPPEPRDEMIATSPVYSPSETAEAPQRAPEGDPFSNDLPPQAVNALKDAGITTLEEARKLTDKELLDLKGFGAGSLARIRSS